MKASATSVANTTVMRNSQNPSIQEMRSLYQWFLKHHRPLNFRKSTDPYHIYVSEIMLQQTRVGSMQGHFARFISRFPSIEDLARVRLDTVLRAWSGLGYYARPKNLHLAAKKIMREHAGVVPPVFADLMNLPGIGPYTSRAILSLAFQLPFATVDINVQRIMNRYYHGHQKSEKLGKQMKNRELQKIADEWLAIGLRLYEGMPQATSSFGLRLHEGMPQATSSLHNQALMELGAVICQPLEPHCSSCSLRNGCAHYAVSQKNRAKHSQERMHKNVSPKKKRGTMLGPRKEAIPLDWFSFIIWHPENILALTVKSTEFPFLKDYWHFPFFTSSPKLGQKFLKEIAKNKRKRKMTAISSLYKSHHHNFDHARCDKAYDFHFDCEENYGNFSHSITEYKIQVRVLFTKFFSVPDIFLREFGNSCEQAFAPPLQWRWQAIDKMEHQSNLNKKIVFLLKSKSQPIDAKLYPKHTKIGKL